MKTLSDVQSATDAELITFWNDHADGGKTFDKITNREKFEKWCMELIGELEQEAAADADEQEETQTRKDVKLVATGNALTGLMNQMNTIAAASTKPIAPVADKVAATPKKAKEPKPDAARSSNAAGVAASWADASVASARLQRDGVSVTAGPETTTPKSVREAFRAYRLPDSKHIRFRLKLKASKREVFEHEGKSYLFTIG
jgi:hypothetical protein